MWLKILKKRSIELLLLFVVSACGKLTPYRITLKNDAYIFPRFESPTETTYINNSNKAAFPFSGLCITDDGPVTVSMGTESGSYTCTDGTFSGTINLTAIADGPVTLIATQTTASSTINTSSVNLNKDVIAPTLAISSPTAASYINSHNHTSFTVSGTCETGGGYILFSIGSANGSAVCAGGVFSGSLDASSLADGAVTASALQSDVAGNVASAANVNFNKETVVPSISLTSTTGGNILKGGASQAITWTASDTNLGATPISIESSSNSGTTYSAVAGPLANSGTYSWTVPSANSTNYRVKVTVSDIAGNTVSASSTSNFTIDSTAPTFTAAAMTLNGGATTTTNNYLTVNLQSSDNLTNITHFCLKYDDTSTPTSTANCWVAVNAPSPGLTPALSLNLSNFNYGVGFAPATYNVYAWAKDEAGNISTLSSAGAGTAAQDKASITYAPGTAPVITDILATGSDSPSNPPSAGDLTIPSGQTVIIKWKITDDAAIPAGAVSLYYTTDDVNYVLINSGVHYNAANGACTINHAGTTADDNATGCYPWTNGSPTSGYFRIRIGVTDASSKTTYSTSAPINVTSQLNFLAGNTDTGLGGSAMSAMFYAEKSNLIFSDPGTLLVASNGTLYHRDVSRGIIKVSPENGLQQLLIPTTGTATGDNGPISSATLRSPIKIALDYQDRILIYDYNKIRRINTNLNPMTIETIIGGGASTAEGVAATNYSLMIYGLSGQDQKHLTFVAAPNGDIYFSHGSWQTLGNGWKLKVYHAATGTIDTFNMSGTGTWANASQDITQCLMCNVGITFNSSTSAITKLVLATESGTGCAGGSVGLINIDPSTGLAAGPHPPHSTTAIDRYAYKFSGRNGKLYSFYKWTGEITEYNSGTNTWTRIAGNGTMGQSCNDGDTATSCTITPMDVFVTAQGVVHFIDSEMIRIVDSNGKIRTIAGQSRSFGDGGNALSARFNVINNIGQKSNGDVILFDANEYRFREISASTGNVSTISGNGINGSPDTVALASAQKVRHYTGYGASTDDFIVEPTTGDVYYSRVHNIARLNRSTGKWQDLVGGGATSFVTADGLVGSSIANTPYDPPRILGFDGTNVLASVYGYNADSYYKLYTIANGTQSHLAGNAVTDTNYCTDGTSTATCKVPSFAVQVRMTYDSYNVPARWVTLKYNTNALRGLEIGANATTITSLATAASSFAYRHDASNNIVYYCSTTDFKIHKKDITGATDVALNWPVSAMKCTGRSMIYNSGTSRLIFPYTLNGLAGIAEYINP